MMLRHTRCVAHVVTALSSLMLSTSMEAQPMTTPQPVAGDVAPDIGSTPAKQRSTTADSSVRPFRINVPEAALMDLKRRLAATRLPTKELVKDRSQGVQLATMSELVR